MARKLVTLRGVIIPAEWDEKGNVIAIAIATHNEYEYVIDDQGNTEKHFDLLRKEVKLEGWLRNEGGSEIITIKTYKEISREH